MILTDIEAKLKEIDPNVFYGMVDKSMMETVWNYIVFNRTTIKHSTNLTSDTDYFDVHIIRENYIPDGLENDVIKKMREIPGVRVSADSEFDYAAKPNTNIVVEMMTCHFLRARKANVSSVYA